MARQTSSFLMLLLGVTWLSTLPSSKANIPSSVLRELSRINSTEAFLRNMIRPAGQNETTSEVGQLIEDVLFIDAETSSMSDMGINSVASMLAIDDGCSPRNMTVRTPANGDPNVIYWPVCTRLLRCGGCCGDEMLECSPTEETVVGLKFLKARYPQYGATEFIIEGWETIEFPQHVACECRCRVQAHHCNTAVHTYFPDACRCQCINQDQSLSCGSNKRWDDHICQCVCSYEFDCYEDEHFSQDTCRCEVNSPPPRVEPTVPPTPDEIVDPCSSIVCWPGYVPQRDGDSCTCVFPMGLPDHFNIDTNVNNRDRTPGRTGHSVNTNIRTRPADGTGNVRGRSRRNHDELVDENPTMQGRGSVSSSRTRRDHDDIVNNPIAVRQPMVQGRQGHV